MKSLSPSDFTLHRTVSESGGSRAVFVFRHRFVWERTPWVVEFCRDFEPQKEIPESAEGCFRCTYGESLHGSPTTRATDTLIRESQRKRPLLLSSTWQVLKRLKEASLLFPDSVNVLVTIAIVMPRGVLTWVYCYLTVSSTLPDDTRPPPLKHIHSPLSQISMNLNRFRMRFHLRVQHGCRLKVNSVVFGMQFAL